MNIKYQIFNSLPESQLMENLIELHKNIFNTTDHLVYKIQDKPNLLFNIALDGTKVVGYKIGYELDANKYYSWLGGVDANYRNLGIASKLMEQQHQFLKKHGYQVVQTKTMNRWRNMLILNIKHGFDVIETYINKEGLHKIILEKSLLD